MIRKAIQPAIRPAFRSPFAAPYADGDLSLVHIPIYGQSLALGNDPDGASVITSGAVTGHFMLNGGVRAHYDESGIVNVNVAVRQSQIASLVPLQEQANPNDADYGETFAAGMASRMTSKGVFCSMARAAYAIKDLVPYNPSNITDTLQAGIHFTNLYASVLQSRRLAVAAGYSWTLGPMIWKHGEADAGASTSRADYKTRMGFLHDWCTNSLSLAAGSALSGYKIIMDQQALSAAQYAEIAVAAIELHRDTPEKFVCAGPTYQLEFTAANDVHMTSQAYRDYGEKLGQAWQAAHSGGGWEPCHITGVSRSGTTITVTVHVPAPPLVLDTTLVSSVANSGFAYSGAGISAVAITDTGAGDNTGVIQITIDADAGGTLSYAYNNGTANEIGPTSGARGNVRDSDSFAASSGKALPNWLCVDQWVVS